MFAPEDVSFTNSKAKLDSQIPTREVRRIEDGQPVLVDERTFDPEQHMEIEDYEAMVEERSRPATPPAPPQP